MSARSDARAAMATPALLLFVITCLAQLIAGMRGGGGGTTTVSVRGGGIVENSDGDSGSEIVDGDGGAGGVNIDDTGGSSDASDEGDGGSISLERHHHGHDGHRGGGNRYNPSRTDNEVKDDGHFDFYVYSMSYQPEFCRENKERFAGCHSFREDWEGQLTIHGLWPNRSDGTWPSQCTSEPLDTALLSELSDDMAKKWPNVKAPAEGSRGHESFWSHEWSKHGTCSGLAQRDYFATALDLLVPTPPIVRENYGSTVSKAQLEEHYNGGSEKASDVVLICKFGYLSEVRACFDRGEDGSRVGERMDCPEAVSREGSCDDDIKIASFDSQEILTAVE